MPIKESESLSLLTNKYQKDEFLKNHFDKNENWTAIYREIKNIISSKYLYLRFSFHNDFSALILRYTQGVYLC